MKLSEQPAKYKAHETRLTAGVTVGPKFRVLAIRLLPGSHIFPEFSTYETLQLGFELLEPGTLRFQMATAYNVAVS